MYEKEDFLENEITDSIKKNLLWVEENIRENLTISQGKLGVEVDINISLSEFVDEFVEDIMNIIKKPNGEKSWLLILRGAGCQKRN